LPSRRARTFESDRSDYALAAACLDWIPRRVHTPSGLLVEEGISTRTADVPGADDLMMLVCVATTQKER